MFYLIRQIILSAREQYQQSWKIVVWLIKWIFPLAKDKHIYI